MEVIVCSTCPVDTNVSHFLQKGRIHHIPDALLIQLGVSRDKFQPSILHTETSIIGSFHKQSYLKVMGTLVFQHPKSKRIASLPFAADTMLADDVVGAFTRITFVGWSENDQIVVFMSHLQCKLRLGIFPFRHINRKNEEFVAVPISCMPTMSDDIRDALCTMRCQFGVNVSFPTEPRGTATFRSCLIPEHLVATNKFPQASLRWSILATRPSLMCLELSRLFETEFDIRLAGTTSLEDILSRCHTDTEKRRVSMEVLPKIRDLTQGESLFDTVEFISSSGCAFYDMTVHKLDSVAIAFFEKRNAC